MGFVEEPQFKPLGRATQGCRGDERRTGLTITI